MIQFDVKVEPHSHTQPLHNGQVSKVTQCQIYWYSARESRQIPNKRKVYSQVFESEVSKKKK